MSEFNLPPGVTSKMIEDAFYSNVPESLPGDEIIEVPVLFRVNVDYLLRLTDDPSSIPTEQEAVEKALLFQLSLFSFCDLEDVVEVSLIPTLTEARP